MPRKFDSIDEKRTYQCWADMKYRCYNKYAKRFNDYGGRDITVCNGWQDFKNFLSDMGLKPQGLTLDRIDNNKGYSKDNCRWASYTEQNINTRIRETNNTGIKGVCLDKRKKSYWRAYFQIDKDKRERRAFSDFFEACCWRKSMKNKHQK